MAAAIHRYETGQVIIRQGDVSTIALVLDGHIAVRRTTADGRQFMVRIVTRGRLSPVLPLAARPTAADSVALTRSATADWGSEDVRALAKIDGGLAVDILDDVLDSLHEVIGRLDGLLYQNALRRVARVLQQHADFFFAKEPILTRAHLPIMVGTSREMTGRVLRVLEANSRCSTRSAAQLALTSTCMPAHIVSSAAWRF
jgi:CRP-like cAMP-binding protein